MRIILVDLLRRNAEMHHAALGERAQAVVDFLFRRKVRLHGEAQVLRKLVVALVSHGNRRFHALRNRRRTDVLYFLSLRIFLI